MGSGGGGRESESELVGVSARGGDLAWIGTLGMFFKNFFNLV